MPVLGPPAQVIGSDTLGDGNGGAVTVTASESITINGRDEEGNRSGIFSTTGQMLLPTEEQGTGKGGSIEVNVPLLEILDGGISADFRCESCGDAGEVRIQAGRIRLLANGVVSSSTLGDGNGGAVVITAGEAMKIEGRGSAIISATVGGVSRTAVVKVVLYRSASLHWKSGEGSLGRVLPAIAVVTLARCGFRLRKFD